MFKLSASDVDGNREPSDSGSIRTNQFDKPKLLGGTKSKSHVPLGVSKLTKNSRRLFPRDIFFSTCQPPAISWPRKKFYLKKTKLTCPQFGATGPRQIECPVAGNVLPPSSYESPDSQKGMGQRGRRLYYWTIDSVESFGIVETCSTTAISYWEWQVVNQILSIEYRLRWSFLTEKLYMRILSCLPWWVAVYV